MSTYRHNKKNKVFFFLIKFKWENDVPNSLKKHLMTHIFVFFNNNHMSFYQKDEIANV